jgi:hypothetical protein
MTLAGRPLGEATLFEALKAPFFDGLAKLFHEVQIKVHVVQCAQHGGQNLSTVVQVSQIRSREVFAARAVACRIHRAHVRRILGVFDAEHTKTREEVPIAGVSGGHNTIKHVDPAADGFE